MPLARASFLFGSRYSCTLGSQLPVATHLLSFAFAGVARQNEASIVLSVPCSAMLRCVPRAEHLEHMYVSLIK